MEALKASLAAGNSRKPAQQAETPAEKKAAKSKPVAKNDTVTVADERAAADRAGRGELREAPSPSPSASASPSPSPTPSKTPSKSPSKKASTPAGVSSTGTCQASFYADGARTANGEKFDPNGLTAAHKTLPFNTMVRVTNLANNKSVVVRINDRGPHKRHRILDLSYEAARRLDMVRTGAARVKVEFLAASLPFA